MCGICGFFHKKNLSYKELKVMNDTIQHRGPDDAGYYLDRNEEMQVGLAQRRLSIIDLSDKAHQPMANKEENVVVVFNGEIYNFKKIRMELEDKGYLFSSSSDTEVIVNSYMEWGIECVERFNGMFSIAIYDKKKKELLLVRDRLGIKPMYYFYDGQNLVFASELKPIMSYPFFHKSINQKALSMYMANQYIAAPYTIFDKVYKLKPGCFVRLSSNTFYEGEYWNLNKAYENRAIIEDKSEEEYLQSLEELIQDSVQARMISDVPIGAFLSGGIDSSLITAMMQKSSSKPIESFTIGFEENEFNEAEYAKEVAKHLGTNHNEMILSLDKVKGLIEEIPKYFDEPLSDSSILSTMLLSDITRQKVTVALSGDAGDELFCGYGRYINHEKYEKLIGFSKVHNSLGLKKIFKNNWKNTKFSNFTSAENIINLEYLSFLDYYSRIFKNQYEIDEVYTSNFITTKNIQEKSMVQDLSIYVPDDILTKVDRSSMAYSLEARTPFLDHRIVEMSFNMPHNLKYKDGEGKYALKKILYKHVPQKLIDRPKQGFGVPVNKWIKDDFSMYSKNYFDQQFIKQQDLFNFDEIKNVLHEYKNTSSNQVSRVVWSLIVFQMWYEEYML